MKYWLWSAKRFFGFEKSFSWMPLALLAKRSEPLISIDLEKIQYLRYLIFIQSTLYFYSLYPGNLSIWRWQFWDSTLLWRWLPWQCLRSWKRGFHSAITSFSRGLFFVYLTFSYMDLLQIVLFHSSEHVRTSRNFGETISREEKTKEYWVSVHIGIYKLIFLLQRHWALQCPQGFWIPCS